MAGLAAVAVAGSLAACSSSGGNGNGGGPSASAPAPPPGASGPAGQGSIGDPYVPGNGNGGYDVRHYGLKLAITPGGARELDGTAEITATATERLSRFNLDLTGLDVAGVTVDGAAARQRRDGDELEVTAPKPLAKGAEFTVVVRYSGTPKPVSDPILGKYGWIRTSDGVFVACQPSGAHTWFPSNDHPSDKATFDFQITVPKGLTAIANGEPSSGAPSGNGGDGGGSGAPAVRPPTRARRPAARRRPRAARETRPSSRPPPRSPRARRRRARGG
ncbi:hypothetical protein ACFQHO_29705 [Actinomadura yumaensis]|uniref:hypothetical protein n=1 Tax=Actinomadura TaxID=1988 RepID=UPI0028149767|nr:hypothetical protein [Actinomadura sp. J1-007]